MPPVLIANPLQLDLPDIGPVAEPAATHPARPPRHRFRPVRHRHVGESKAELSHFIAGRCTFTPDGGDPIEINAGDAVYFPPGTAGTWDVRETVRKTFVTFEY